MQLTLNEQAGSRLHRQILRRAEAQLVTPLLEVTFLHDEFLRHDRRAVVGLPIGARPIQPVIEKRIVAVVRNRVGGSLHECARVDHVEVADFAFDGQRRLKPRILGVLRTEVRNLQVADRRVEGEETFSVDGLTHHSRGHRPIVTQIDPERTATTLRAHRVVAVLDVGRIADRAGPDGRRCRAGPWIIGRDRPGVAAALRILAAPSRERAHAVDNARARVRARHIVDVAGVVLVPADEPHCRHR